MIPSKCFLCKAIAIDSVDIECGNNAENSVTVDLCEAHSKEHDDLGYDFESKYAGQIEEEWMEAQLGRADMLRKAEKEGV